MRRRDDRPARGEGAPRFGGVLGSRALAVAHIVSSLVGFVACGAPAHTETSARSVTAEPPAIDAGPESEAEGPTPEPQSARPVEYLRWMSASEGRDGPHRGFLFVEHVAVHRLDPPVPGLSTDAFGECEPSIGPIPRELAAQIRVPPTGVAAWLVTDRGPCEVSLAEPLLVRAQSGWACDLVLAYDLRQQDERCMQTMDASARAPVAFLEEVAPTARWVLPVEHAAEPAAVDGGAVRFSFHGVTTELAPELAGYETPLNEGWRDRVRSGEATLLHRARVRSIETPVESIQDRAASWYYFEGTDSERVRCACEGEGGCVSEFYEFLARQRGLVRAGRWSPLVGPGAFRGAVVDQDRVEWLVTGYLSLVAAHRRSTETEFVWEELTSPYLVHEEDSERDPVEQAPYCGP